MTGDNPPSSLRTGFHCVAICEVRGLIPDRLNVEKLTFNIMSRLNVCCTVIVSDFLNASPLLTYIRITATYVMLSDVV